MTAFEWVERFNERVALNTDEHNSLVSLFAQAINEEREACAKRLWDESAECKKSAKSTTIVNDGYLREIESSTFRWAAQLIEARK